MTSVLTVALSGSNTSTLESKFFPEVQLDDDEYEYSCALLDLTVKNVDTSSEFLKSGVVRIHCNIISGSYINGMECTAIHQFVVSASKVQQETLVEIPIHLNYFPFKIRKNLRSIHISIADKTGQPSYIKGDICCRINVKRVIRAKIKNADLP